MDDHTTEGLLVVAFVSLTAAALMAWGGAAALATLGGLCLLAALLREFTPSVSEDDALDDTEGDEP